MITKYTWFYTKTYIIVADYRDVLTSALICWSSMVCRDCINNYSEKPQVLCAIPVQMWLYTGAEDGTSKWRLTKIGYISATRGRALCAVKHYATWSLRKIRVWEYNYMLQNSAPFHYKTKINFQKMASFVFKNALYLELHPLPSLFCDSPVFYFNNDFWPFRKCC